ncbi:anti-sigma factor [Herbiconiux sp. 11R-BC]|uniref:anti-sigma factor n=1 Tax=Herbiconiux sp. 11R-BC TaxID=3111637 RepID=UPI003C09B68C
MTDRTHGDDVDPRLLSGAYALDATSAEEAERFERAASASDSLRDEAEELRETASRLGLAAQPVTPSERMRAELMAKLATTPQLARTSTADAPTDAPTPAPDARSAPAAQPTVAPAVLAPDAPAGVDAPLVAVGPAERRATQRWYTRPAAILAAAAAAAALFVGGGLVGSALNGSGSSVATDASASGLAAIAAAGDTQRSTVPLAGGGTATVVWSAELGRSAVLADGLPTLPDGKVYEAWYIDSSGATPAGTFTAAGSGTSWHVLNGTMAAGDAVGVTVEPAGGSPAPTTDPILVVQAA